MPNFWPVTTKPKSKLNTSVLFVVAVQVHCESNKMENENIVSVILYDTSSFTIGDKYRFCLVLIQKNDDQRDLVVGCSNITKLKQIENTIVGDKMSNITPVTVPMLKSAETITSKTPSTPNQGIISDISSFKKITDLMHQEPREVNGQNGHDIDAEMTTAYRAEVNQASTVPSTTTSKQPIADEAYASQLMNHFNDSLMPSLSIAVLITSIFAFIWAATKITHHRRTIPSTVCYAASDQHSIDIENSNRYLKLQATTTL